MNALDLARWQFAVTTVYHFFFVPITIGMSVLVAVLQTAWVRTGKPEYLRATRFWGKLFLINFSMGVVTGIVQEFQFGMNWSAYSRFVGDIFGAPLAIEGLLAFFLESTFLGLWIFGWDRLPKRIHLASIWLASIGTMLSAYFILAANSWMQHPVGYHYNPATGRAELTSLGKVLTNSTVLTTFPHVIVAAFLTGGTFMLAVSAWHMARRRQVEVFRPSMRLALWVTLVAGVFAMISGDQQGRMLTTQQPMKMAAAEALYNTSAPAPFSLLTIGTVNGRQPLASLRIPDVLSLLSTHSLDGKVDGINNLQAAAVARYGPGNYVPYVPVTYWSFRLMIGFGALAALIALVGLWLTRRDRLPSGRGSRWFWAASIMSVGLPLAANSFGWIFTEMGRQPWTVFGVLKTASSLSPTVGAGTVLTSLIVFTLLYGALAVVEVSLLVRYARKGAPPIPEAGAEDSEQAGKTLTFAY